MIIPMMDIDGIGQLQRAASMAAAAHAGQTMRSTEIPYIAHPMRVAGLVMGAFGCTDSDIVAAALLHDTLEKTSLGPDEIAGALGAKVLKLVRVLTKNKDDGEEFYWHNLTNGSWEARLVKMADALDHLNCPLEHLTHRIEIAGKALELANSNEEPILTARQALRASLRDAEVRLATALVPD
jgi:(p)ppGpp synthase/HD superfamily hydrolase